jgi:hypothetical protein
MPRVRAALLAGVAAAALPGAAAAQDVDYYGSASFSTGSYIFTETTRTLSVVNGLSVETGRLRVDARIPIIFQDSRAVAFAGTTILPTGGPGAQSVGDRQQGRSVRMGRDGAAAAGEAQAADSIVAAPGAWRPVLGDPFLGASVALRRGRDVLRRVDVTTGIKIPVSRVESGVGTGAWDCGAGVAATWDVGPVLVLTDMTYWWYGDMPTLELRDGASVSAGLGVPLTPAWWLSLTGHAGNRVIPTAAAARSVSAGASYLAPSGTQLMLSVGAGLSESAPAVSVSIGIRHGLHRAHGS